MLRLMQEHSTLTGEKVFLNPRKLILYLHHASDCLKQLSYGIVHFPGLFMPEFLQDT